MDIMIRKRNGSFEKLCVEKTKKMVAYACNGLEGCSPMELEMDSNIQFRDGMSTKEIQKILIQTAIEKMIQTTKDSQGNVVKTTNINWQNAAARLLMSDLYKEAAINRGYHHFGYGDFTALVGMLAEQEYYGEFFMGRTITHEDGDIIAISYSSKTDQYEYKDVMLYDRSEKLLIFKDKDNIMRFVKQDLDSLFK